MLPGRHVCVGLVVLCLLGTVPAAVRTGAAGAVPVGRWYPAPLQRLHYQMMLGVDATPACDAVAVGLFGRVFMRHRCGDWHETFRTGGLGEIAALNAVSLRADGHGWAVGADGHTYIVDLGAFQPLDPFAPAVVWSSQPVTTTLTDVAAAADGTAWAVGTGGVVLRFDGGVWHDERSGITVDLLGIAVDGPTQGWIVGEDGTILELSVDGWHLDPSGLTDVRLEDVAVGPSGSAWAVGERGTLLGYRDGAWQPAASPVAATLYSVSIAPSGVGWALGVMPDRSAAVLFFDGKSWSPFESEIPAALRGVKTLGPHRSLAVGHGNLVYDYDVVQAFLPALWQSFQPGTDFPDAVDQTHTGRLRK